MIAAHGLTKLFGSFAAVDSADFEIPRGQVAGFLGPNGAGKTTTIRMLTGYLPPTSGRAEIEGVNVAEHSMQVRRRIGYLPESAPVYGEMRVREYLQYRARLFSIPRMRRRAAIDLAAKRCLISDVGSRPIHQLSKGYRQRVGLAAALLHEPPVLILDEPTSGLDPAQVREVRKLIRSLAGEQTILLSTHILPEIELTCDRVVMIAHGRIRASGTLEQLRARQGDVHYVIEADSADVEAALREIAPTAHITSGAVNGRWRRTMLRASQSAGDLREPIAQALAARGTVVRELRIEAPSLEQLFVKVLSDAGGPDRSPGREPEAAR